MHDLSQKIRNTALFSPDEKIEILAALDTFSDSDKEQLGDIVDQYDREFEKITFTFKQNMVRHLGEMEKSVSPANLSKMREAIEKIKSGLDAVVATPTS